MYQIPSEYRSIIIAVYVSFAIYAVVRFLIFHNNIHGQESVDVFKLVVSAFWVGVYAASIYFLCKPNGTTLVIIIALGFFIPIRTLLVYWDFAWQNMHSMLLTGQIIFFGQFVPIAGASLLFLSKARMFYLLKNEQA